MTYENMKEQLKKVKEIILFLLLAIWMMIPFFKDIEKIWLQAMTHEYSFILFVGVIGVTFLIIDIYSNSMKSGNKRKYDKEMLPITIFGIFMLWTLISCLFSKDIKTAFWGTSYRKDGYFTYVAYAGFFSCAYLLKFKKSKKIIINMLVIVAILNIIITQLSNMGFMTEIFVKNSISTTVFFQFNHFGYYLLIATVSSIFLFVTQKNKFLKILYLLAYTFLLYYLILNNTFGCYLSLALTLIFFVIYSIYHKKNRCMSIFLVILFIIMSVAIPKTRVIVQKNINTLFKDINNIIVAEKSKNNDIITEKLKNDDIDAEEEKIIKRADKAGTGRISLWKNGIKFFLERPILGYGPENLREKYSEVGINQDRPHNLLIQLATTSGIIGIVTYVTVIVIILIRGVKRLNMENQIHTISFFVVVSYLISAMFGNSMYYTSPYFFIFLGFLMNENIKCSKDNVK